MPSASSSNLDISAGETMRPALSLDVIHSRTLGASGWDERVHVLGRVHVARVLANESLNQRPGSFGPENVVEKLRQCPTPQVQHFSRHLPVEPEVQRRQGNTQCAVPHLGAVAEWRIPHKHTE